MSRAPAEGERIALGGYIPQYDFAAAVVLEGLRDRTIKRIGLVDPEAGILDDVQIEREDRLDAYQVKWSQTEAHIPRGEFRSLLLDLVASRDAIVDRLEVDGDTKEVVGHLITNRQGSETKLPTHESKGISSFVVEAWTPAHLGEFGVATEIPEEWQAEWAEIAAEGGLTSEQLLEVAPKLEVKLGLSDPRPVGGDRESLAYLGDLEAMRNTLLDLAVDQGDRVWFTRAEIIDHLGGDWARRLGPLANQSFPSPIDYEPIQSTIGDLESSISDLDGGYIVLLGSPGSGKSTLLTQHGPSPF